MDVRKASSELKSIIGLGTEPVAVKFFEEPVELPGFELPGDRRYCQILMGARHGQKYLLTAENIACPAAAWALGFKEPPEMLSSGQMPFKMGIFGSAEAARNTLSSMTRFPMGKYKMVAACPLGEAPFEPDVVVIESDVEHLMWIALARAFETGGRLTFDTAILQATCVDCTIEPFVNQEMNATLGCYGCREATDMAESETVLGFPAKQLEQIVTALEKLNAHALPRVRSKKVYRALMARQHEGGDGKND